MGDRAQVAIKFDNSVSVYLYTHWHGIVLEETVRQALARRQRWDDDEYLARIIFCQMIKGYEAAETGFGIGVAEHEDNEHPLIVVDPGKQTVTVGEKAMSFEKFVKNGAGRG